MHWISFAQPHPASCFHLRHAIKDFSVTWYLGSQKPQNQGFRLASCSTFQWMLAEYWGGRRILSTFGRADPRHSCVHLAWNAGLPQPWQILHIFASQTVRIYSTCTLWLWSNIYIIYIYISSIYIYRLGPSQCRTSIHCGTVWYIKPYKYQTAPYYYSIPSSHRTNHSEYLTIHEPFKCSLHLLSTYIK